MMEGSGETMYQPFDGSQNFLRASTTTTTTTATTTTTTTTTTTRRTTQSTNPPQPVTQDPNIQVYARGTIVRNDFGTHIVLGK